MRWPAKKCAQHGDRRVVHPFAWWPVTMSDGSTVVWLEWYVLIQEFEPVDISGALGWVGRRSYPCETYA